LAKILVFIYDSHLYLALQLYKCFEVPFQRLCHVQSQTTNAKLINVLINSISSVLIKEESVQFTVIPGPHLTSLMGLSPS
jgi:nitrate reductase gamma subunit